MQDNEEDTRDKEQGTRTRDTSDLLKILQLVP